MMEEVVKMGGRNPNLSSRLQLQNWEEARVIGEEVSLGTALAGKRATIS